MACVEQLARLGDARLLDTVAREMKPRNEMQRAWQAAQLRRDAAAGHPGACEVWLLCGHDASAVIDVVTEPATLQLLLARNVDPRRILNKDEALRRAVALPMLDLAKTLIGAGANPNAAVNEAARQADPRALQLLVARGASSECIADKALALRHAVNAEDEKMLVGLLRVGADPNIALDVAARLGTLRMLAALVAAGADAKRLEDKSTLLMRATVERRWPLMRALVGAGANPTLALDASVAIAAKNPESLLLILACGVDPRLLSDKAALWRIVANLEGDKRYRLIGVILAQRGISPPAAAHWPSLQRHAGQIPVRATDVFAAPAPRPPRAPHAVAVPQQTS